MCKIKVKKAGFNPVERMINAYDGFSITVTLEPTETERNKLQQQIRFLQEIKSGEVLNQTQLKQYCEQLRGNGFKTQTGNGVYYVW